MKLWTPARRHRARTPAAARSRRPLGALIAAGVVLAVVGYYVSAVSLIEPVTPDATAVDADVPVSGAPLAAATEGMAGELGGVTSTDPGLENQPGTLTVDGGGLRPSADAPPEPIVTSTAVAMVSADWAAEVAAKTGIPQRALVAYAAAALTVGEEQPRCGLGWNTVAAIGFVESGHGSHGGATLTESGLSSPLIRGPALSGGDYAAIRDSDGGAWDGDAVWDRAVGPMQFIPSTWATWTADGNGDGVGDPNQVDDAALATARYLCHSGSVSTPEQWRAAVFSYNHLDSYVDLIAQTANGYARQGG
ncbi:membrane-bound lytic murein transglycosylase B [Glaciihabitans tibetensis]|uniref:Membrane-bound lytic murein transglycosylase B n=1 Tax=Glaciihabitans tibetensis TaxID=1266600 RepID=A0A2T0VCM0_9MICO|nr:lytic transglycosylase domain-containing protein [Glaciihabitans tibetensis]PRY67927.1 membrane-bound lytic murein transglycosylase B [Glaciihabitans tibetensis]